MTAKVKKRKRKKKRARKRATETETKRQRQRDGHRMCTPGLRSQISHWFGESKLA